DKSGDVFVSTGSKELSVFEVIGSRVRARVLDTNAVHEKCRNLKISRILYKMPPFSYEDNIKDFNGCRYLVTKDSGKAGGIDEKLRAAKALGMEVVMIQRPEEGREGYTLEELESILQGDNNDTDNRGSIQR
ncbi:MAG: precorrin-6A/cobalt-precorrin-6A reductase, partial [Candidatus Ornithomonoglobus sp.]